jgi:hypothetical protein
MDMTLPQVEKQLEDLFGTLYDVSNWHPALNAVLVAENDSTKALEAIHQLSKAAAA